MTGRVVDEVLGRLTGVDHEAIGELHALGTSSAELAGNDNLTALGARLHDEAKHTVAGAADGKTVEELVAEGLALSNGGETTGLDLGGVEGDRVGWEAEAVGDQAGELEGGLVVDMQPQSLGLSSPHGFCDPAHQEPPGCVLRG